MSITGDDLQASSDSFWEVDQFKRTVKRQEDGLRLCSELMTLIQERADIEKMYSKNLRTWAKKWGDAIEKGPEYGTTEAAWRGCLSEAEDLAEVHTGIKESLVNNVQAQISQWKKENFHKPMVGPCKETKQIEDEFKKAQKPWSKKLAKVVDSKKKYHTACKLEKTATNQENNARSDSAVSSDQLKKLQDKADKCRKDVQSTKEKYEGTLGELNSYNAKYMEDMEEVFRRSQDMEEKRLKFFKEMLFGIHHSLDLSAKPAVPQIYAQLRQTIDQADYNKDLMWWSQNHGTGMAMNWPQFEEYSTEFHAISRKEKKAAGGEGITLTSIQKNNSHQPPKAVQQQPTSSQNHHHAPPQAISAPTPVQSSSASQNPFGDEEQWDDGTDYDNHGLEDPGTEGVAVRAMYDYDGQEEDELTFKTGDVFVMLKERDDQGWCTGRKDGKVGLFPDNYVQPV